MNRNTEKYYLVRKDGELSVVKGVRGSEGSPPSITRISGDTSTPLQADVIVAVEVPPGVEPVITVVKNRSSSRHGVIHPES